MRQSKGLTLYFQREDWRGTHNCVALNNSNVGELYIDIYYEDNRYAKGYETAKSVIENKYFDKVSDYIEKLNTV